MINSKINKFLKQSYQRDRLSQAYLFVGPKDAGKIDAVIDFISLVNNLKSKEAVIENKNPDIVFVEPDLDTKKQKKKNISVDQVREATKKISYYSYQEEKKFLVIAEAERLNLTAANSLLKNIEEPDADTIVILITSNEGRILSTIRSRCQKIFFGLESQENIEKYLKNKYPQKNKEDITRVAELSWGRCKMAERLLVDSKLLKEKKEIFDKFKKALKGGINEGMDLTEKISGDKETMIESIEEWVWYLRIFLKKSITEKQDKEIQKKVSGMINRLLEIKKKIETTNVNEKLQLENFFVQIG